MIEKQENISKSKKRAEKRDPETGEPYYTTGKLEQKIIAPSNDKQHVDDNRNVSRKTIFDPEESETKNKLNIIGYGEKYNNSQDFEEKVKSDYDKVQDKLTKSYLYVGSFSDQKEAKDRIRIMSDKMQSLQKYSTRVDFTHGKYRIVIGPLDENDANPLMNQLVQNGYYDAFISNNN